MLQARKRGLISEEDGAELGIDISVINSVAQVGPPPSAASLRQRLGRSGRVDTMLLWLTSHDVDVTREGVALVFERMTPEAVETELRKIAAKEPPDAVELARRVANKERETFHP